VTWPSRTRLNEIDAQFRRWAIQPAGAGLTELSHGQGAHRHTHAGSSPQQGSELALGPRPWMAEARLIRQNVKRRKECCIGATKLEHALRRAGPLRRKTFQSLGNFTPDAGFRVPAAAFRESKWC